MARSEFQKALDDGLNEFCDLWKEISGGYKFSDQFKPDKCICLLLQDLGKDPMITAQAETVFNDTCNLYVSTA